MYNIQTKPAGTWLHPPDTVDGRDTAAFSFRMTLNNLMLTTYLEWNQQPKTNKT